MKIDGSSMVATTEPVGRFFASPLSSFSLDRLSDVGAASPGSSPAQKLPHSRSTRFPSGIGGRKLLITAP